MVKYENCLYNQMSNCFLREFGESLGNKIIDTINDNFFGEKIIVGQNKTIRNKRIIHAFNGTNIPELSQRFDLSERWIRVILKDKKNIEIKD